MSGRKSRDKGYREEAAVVRAWQERGFGCQRVPNSGSSGGSFAGDVRLWTVFGEMTFEVKSRANGFKQLYDWLGDNDALCIRADRKPRLYVLTEDRLAELLAEAEGGAV